MLKSASLPPGRLTWALGDETTGLCILDNTASASFGILCRQNRTAYHSQYLAWEVIIVKMVTRHHLRKLRREQEEHGV